MDAKSKFTLMKFIGEVLARPESFQKDIQVVAREEGGAIVGEFRATGTVGEFLKGVLNVQR